MRNSEQETNVIMSCRQRLVPLSFKIVLCCVALFPTGKVIQSETQVQNSVKTAFQP